MNLVQYKPKIGQFWADSLPKKFFKTFWQWFYQNSVQNWLQKGPELANFRPEKARRAFGRARAGSGLPKNLSGGRALVLARGPTHH